MIGRHAVAVQIADCQIVLRARVASVGVFAHANVLVLVYVSQHTQLCGYLGQKGWGGAG